MQRHIDGREQFPVHERFYDVTVRPCFLCLCQTVVVDICRQVYHRDIEALLRDPCGLYTVNLTHELDVHEDDMRRVLPYLLKCIFTKSDRFRDNIAGTF